MSPRSMRRYKAPTLICAGCLLKITGEVRMLAGELYHPVCAAKRPTPESRA